MACRLYRPAWVPLGCSIGALGGFMRDSGYQNIDILVDISAFWQYGAKIIDFGVPSQTKEYQPGLTREGNLLNWRLGWATGLASRLY